MQGGWSCGCTAWRSMGALESSSTSMCQQVSPFSKDRNGAKTEDSPGKLHLLSCHSCLINANLMLRCLRVETLRKKFCWTPTYLEANTIFNPIPEAIVCICHLPAIIPMSPPFPPSTSAIMCISHHAYCLSCISCHTYQQPLPLPLMFPYVFCIYFLKASNYIAWVCKIINCSRNTVTGGGQKKKML